MSVIVLMESSTVMLWFLGEVGDFCVSVVLVALCVLVSSSISLLMVPCDIGK